MDYNRVYAEFIKDRRAREIGLEGYVERHHIVPRCLGGGNNLENLIRLTAGDHFFAHLLLARVHGGALWYAVNSLIGGASIGGRALDKHFMTRARRWYERTKIESALAHSVRMKGRYCGPDHPMYGKPCSPIALEKLRARIAGGWNPMGSQESRNKLSAALKGRKFTPEWRDKIAASRQGKPLSEATRANMRAGHLGKKLSADVVAKIAASNRGKKRTLQQTEAMKARLTGRKLSAEHVEKLRPHLAKLSRFRGKSHSDETRRRMAAVCSARREYRRMFGGDVRTVTIAMMEAAGLTI